MIALCTGSPANRTAQRPKNEHIEPKYTGEIAVVRILFGTGYGVDSFELNNPINTIIPDIIRIIPIHQSARNAELPAPNDSCSNISCTLLTLILWNMPIIDINVDNKKEIARVTSR
jgi:hypothetical protein